MIRNCENEKYAHTITSARRNFPRSCRWRCVRTRDMGSRDDRMIIRVIRNAIEESPCPAIRSSPNIVENQWGLSESTQSIDMKVMLKPQKTNPGPEIDAIFP